MDASGHIGHVYWDEVELKRHGWADRTGQHWQQDCDALPLDSVSLLQHGVLDKSGRHLPATSANFTDSFARGAVNVPDACTQTIEFGDIKNIDYDPQTNYLGWTLPCSSSISTVSSSSFYMPSEGPLHNAFSVLTI